MTIEMAERKMHSMSKYQYLNTGLKYVFN